MNEINQLNIMGRSVLLRPATDPDSSRATLILLHGYGADEYDLMGLAGYFREDVQVLSIRGGRTTPYGGVSWFDIDMAPDGSLKFNIEQARESTNTLISIIDEMKKDGIIGSTKMILAGFSQGATISNLVTFQKPEIIQALLIMSGRLPRDAGSFITDQSIFKEMPIFAGHGTHDNVIPIEYGRQIVQFWDPLSRLEHHEYPMGHEISQAEISDIQSWMDKILS